MLHASCTLLHPRCTADRHRIFRNASSEACNTTVAAACNTTVAEICNTTVAKACYITAQGHGGGAEGRRGDTRGLRLKTAPAGTAPYACCSTYKTYTTYTYTTYTMYVHPVATLLPLSACLFLSLSRAHTPPPGRRQLLHARVGTVQQRFRMPLPMCVCVCVCVTVCV